MENIYCKTVFDFGYHDNAIHHSVCTKSILGTVAGNQIGVGDINIIDTTPVPCRKSTLPMSKYNNSVSQDDEKGGKESKSLLSSI